MSKLRMSAIAGLILMLVLACSDKAVSKAQFIFKPAPNKTAAAKYKGVEISFEELNKDIQNDIYELEKKIFDTKMGRLKSLLLKKMMESDPKFKGMTNDAYLEKYIAGNIKVSSKQVDAFALERKIPKAQINDQMKERIRNYLLTTEKQKAVQNWMDRQMAKNPVEVYIKKPQAPVFDVKVGNAPAMGKASAKVTIVEFSDFECPFCSKGASIMTELKKKYGNKIRVAFKNFPLPFHKKATQAAMAGLCAHEQKAEKFWKMHDEMFAHQDNLGTEGLMSFAKKVGLNTQDFKKCLESKKFAAQIEADKKQGQDLGVKSTPTFFVNGKLVSGAVPVEVFSEYIDEELAK